MSSENKHTRSGVRIQQGQEIFLFSRISRLALEPTFRGVQRSARERDRLPPTSVEVKNEESHIAIAVLLVRKRAWKRTLGEIKSS